MLRLENDLNYFTQELQRAEKTSEVKLLNNLITTRRTAIMALFFATQNIIMKKFFLFEFNSLRNLEDLKDFQQRLYDFQNLIGVTDGYEFYNNFYTQMMESLERKREYIEHYGEINLFEPNNTTTALVAINNTKSSFAFVGIFFKKLKKLFRTGTVTQKINEAY